VKFKTDYIYMDRRTKALYIYLKYQSILVGDILDVGADQCYLKKYLCKNAKYVGIGSHSDKLNLEINLEKRSLPIKDNSFNVVLYCDVLEHLGNIHNVFGKLWRISKKYVIILLPNPSSTFLNYLKHGDYNKHQSMKFYGLPLEKPEYLHKWFFSTDEAARFIRYRAKKNNMEIVQIDVEEVRVSNGGIIEKLIFKFLSKKYSKLYFNLPFNRNLYTGTLWAVLKKKEAS